MVSRPEREQGGLPLEAKSLGVELMDLTRQIRRAADHGAADVVEQLFDSRQALVERLRLLDSEKLRASVSPEIRKVILDDGNEIVSLLESRIASVAEALDVNERALQLQRQVASLHGHGSARVDLAC